MVSLPFRGLWKMTDKLRDDFSATASKEVASITASGPYGSVGYTMIDAIVRREIARARAEALEEAASIPFMIDGMPSSLAHKTRNAIRALK